MSTPVAPIPKDPLGSSMPAGRDSIPGTFAGHKAALFTALREALDKGLSDRELETFLANPKAAKTRVSKEIVAVFEKIKGQVPDLEKVTADQLEKGKKTLRTLRDRMGLGAPTGAIKEPSLFDKIKLALVGGGAKETEADVKAVTARAAAGPSGSSPSSSKVRAAWAAEPSTSKSATPPASRPGTPPTARRAVEGREDQRIAGLKAQVSKIIDEAGLKEADVKAVRDSINPFKTVDFLKTPIGPGVLGVYAKRTFTDESIVFLQKVQAFKTEADVEKKKAIFKGVCSNLSEYNLPDPIAKAIQGVEKELESGKTPDKFGSVFDEAERSISAMYDSQFTGRDGVEYAMLKDRFK